MIDESGNPKDAFGLDRFLKAQAPIFDIALAELRAGRKQSHWMWFIFPQLAGLGKSSTAMFYAIKNEREARAYLEHAVLGRRLVETAEALLTIHGKTAYEILGTPDDLKLHSSMTLFSRAAERGSVFARVLEQYYAGQEDARTAQLLKDNG